MSDAATCDGKSLELSRDESKKEVNDSVIGGPFHYAQSLVERYGARNLMVLAGTNLLSGLLAIDYFAIDYMLKDELHLSPASAQFVTMTLMVPFAIKPLWGLVTDTTTISGYRRRPFYLLFGSLSFVCTFLLGNCYVVEGFNAIMVLLTVRAVGFAFIDVIVDAVLAEQARLDIDSGAHDLQTLCSFHRALGSVVASIAKGYMLTEFGPRPIFTIMAFIISLPLVILACILPENPAPTVDPFCVRLRSQTILIKEAFRSPHTWRLSTFVFLSTAFSPSIPQVYFYYGTNYLHFSPPFMASLSLLASIACILGTLLYRWRLKSVSFCTIYTWSQIGVIFANVCTILLVLRLNIQLGISDKVFVVADSIALSIVRYVQVLPVSVLFAKMCPRGIEGTMFAGFDAIVVCSHLLSTMFGGILAHVLGITETNFESLWILQSLVIIFKIFPLIYIKWLIKEDVDHYASPLVVISTQSSAL